MDPSPSDNVPYQSNAGFVTFTEQTKVHCIITTDATSTYTKAENSNADTTRPL